MWERERERQREQEQREQMRSHSPVHSLSECCGWAGTHTTSWGAKSGLAHGRQESNDLSHYHSVPRSTLARSWNEESVQGNGPGTVVEHGHTQWQLTHRPKLLCQIFLFTYYMNKLNTCVCRYVLYFKIRIQTMLFPIMYMNS